MDVPALASIEVYRGDEPLEQLRALVRRELVKLAHLAELCIE
jgi:hypothetical protein